MPVSLEITFTTIGRRRSTLLPNCASTLSVFECSAITILAEQVVCVFLESFYHDFYELRGFQRGQSH